MLIDAYFTALNAEATPLDADTRDELLAAFVAQVESRLEELRRIDLLTLTDARLIGRAKLPSTVLGCIVHAAEHGMRHWGQLVVTVKVLQAGHH